MKKQSNNSSSDYTKPDGLPHVHFLLINDNGRTRIVDLDEYAKDELEIIVQIYEREIEKYGEQNVKLCRVVSARVKKTIEFME